jgi:neutral ceramidase
LTRSLTAPAKKETEIEFTNDALQFSGRFDRSAEFDIRICTILINKDIVIATCPGEPFSILQLDWKAKMNGTHPFLFGYTWYEGTWPNYIPDIASAARGGYGADIEGPTMIEVGSGERIMNKHLENYYRLAGLMRAEPGPSGFKRESRWIMQEVPR